MCRKCPLHISSVCHYIRDIRYMCGETADPRLCPQAESNPQSLDRESYRHLNQHTTIPYDHLTVSRVPPRGRLRSADTTDYLVPRARSKFREGAFCFRAFGLELSPRVTANCRFRHHFSSQAEDSLFGRPLGPGLCHRKSVRPSVCNVGGLWPNGLGDRDDFWHTPCPGQQ